MLRELGPSIPTGYRKASEASGLIVPEDTPREREVWTKDEQKMVDRALRFLASKRIKFQMACMDPKCKGHKLEDVLSPDGGSVLRCQHKDRILQRTH